MSLLGSVVLSNPPLGRAVATCQGLSRPLYLHLHLACANKAAVRSRRGAIKVWPLRAYIFWHNRWLLDQALLSDLHADAINAFGKALQDQPQDPTMLSNRCAAFLASGKTLAALQDAQDCVKVCNPIQYSVPVRAEHGQSSPHLCSPQEAPSWPKAWYRLASCYASMAAWQPGETAAAQGLSLLPNNKVSVWLVESTGCYLGST